MFHRQQPAAAVPSLQGGVAAKRRGWGKSCSGLFVAFPPPPPPSLQGGDGWRGEGGDGGGGGKKKFGRVVLFVYLCKAF